MPFFSAATYFGFFVLLAGTGVAYAGGSSLSAAVTRGAIGFGITLMAGYLADVVAMSAPPKTEGTAASAGPLIRTITALSEGAAGIPPVQDEYDNSERKLAA